MAQAECTRARVHPRPAAPSRWGKVDARARMAAMIVTGHSPASSHQGAPAAPPPHCAAGLARVARLFFHTHAGQAALRDEHRSSVTLVTAAACRFAPGACVTHEQRRRCVVNKNICLDESRIPQQWYNIVADFPERRTACIRARCSRPDRTTGAAVPDGPHRSGGIGGTVHSDPEEVRDIYRIWRPTPLVRAPAWRSHRHQFRSSSSTRV